MSHGARLLTTIAAYLGFANNGLTKLERESIKSGSMQSSLWYKACPIGNGRDAKYRRNRRKAQHHK